MGFNLCPGCGNLAEYQTPMNAAAFASCAIERPGMRAQLCACKASP
jgi:hypothetical protein